MGTGCSETGVTDGHKQSGGSWELNLGPLEIYPVLLIGKQSFRPGDSGVHL